MRLPNIDRIAKFILEGFFVSPRCDIVGGASTSIATTPWLRTSLGIGGTGGTAAAGESVVRAALTRECDRDLVRVWRTGPAAEGDGAKESCRNKVRGEGDSAGVTSIGAGSGMSSGAGRRRSRPLALGIFGDFGLLGVCGVGGT